MVALIGGFVPADYLWDTVSIGTLMAFIVVALGGAGAAAYGARPASDRSGSRATR